ncbi:MAG: dTMP kinase [Thermoguttaceae bacterium]
MFITFDGGECCGKTTQIARLKDWFEEQGKEVVVVRDPGTTALGDAIRNILLHRNDLHVIPLAEMLLFMSARTQMVQEIIRPALNVGKIVLADRYLLSNIAYQGYGGQVPLEQMRSIGEMVTGPTLPDVGFVLDVSADVAKQRMKNRSEPDRIESRDQEYFDRVRNGFLEEVKRCPDRYKLVDATGTVEVVGQKIRGYFGTVG